MSDVSRSGRVSSRDMLTQLKDQYATREKELERRHRDEIRELKENHSLEIDKLRDETQKRIESVQTESNVKLSDKDVQYQKEIEAIRAMHTKRKS